MTKILCLFDVPENIYLDILEMDFCFKEEQYFCFEEEQHFCFKEADINKKFLLNYNIQILIVYGLNFRSVTKYHIFWIKTFMLTASPSSASKII